MLLLKLFFCLGILAIGACEAPNDNASMQEAQTHDSLAVLRALGVTPSYSKFSGGHALARCVGSFEARLSNKICDAFYREMFAKPVRSSLFEQTHEATKEALVDKGRVRAPWFDETKLTQPALKDPAAMSKVWRIERGVEAFEMTLIGLQQGEGFEIKGRIEVHPDLCKTRILDVVQGEAATLCGDAPPDVLAPIENKSMALYIDALLEALNAAHRERCKQMSLF